MIVRTLEYRLLLIMTTAIVQKIKENVKKNCCINNN
jgi:hypothetical protein